MRQLLLCMFVGFALIGCLRDRTEEWGAVLPANEAARLMKPCSRDFPARLSGYWKPSPEGLASLEIRLRPLISPALSRVELGSQTRKAADYKLQYAGFYRQREKGIYVNAVELWDVSERWQDRALIICDGGDSAFGIVHDVETKRFDNCSVFMKIETRIDGTE